MASGSQMNPLALLQFPFSAGIDEANRDEIIEPGGGWLTLENGRQDKRGGYTTRLGFTALSNARADTTTATAGDKLLTDGSAPIRVTNLGQVEVYDATGARWTQVPGRLPEFVQRLIDVPSVGNYHVEDVAYSNGYLVVGWSGSSADGSTTCYAGVINAATGAVVLPPALLGTAERRVFIVALGTNVYLVRNDDSANNIKCWTLSTATAASIAAGWSALTDLATDVYAGDHLAVCAMPHASTPAFAIVYPNDSGGASDLTVKVVTSGAVSDSTTINASSGGVATSALAIAGAIGGTLWVAWDDSANTNFIAFDVTDLSTITGTAAVLLAGAGTTFIGLALDPSDSTVGRALTYNGTYSSTIAFSISGGAATAGTAKTIYAVQPAGKPIAYADPAGIQTTRYYAPVFVGDATTTVQAQLVIVDWTDDKTYFRPVACPTPGLATISGWLGCQMATDDAGKLYFGLGIKRSAVADAAAVLELDAFSASRWQSVPYGRSVYLSGSVLSYFDGIRVCEASFLVRPPQPTTGTGGTGITAATGWRYVCVYEAVDSDGNWHISGLSTVSASTGAVTNKTVTVTTKPLTVSSRLGATSAETSVRVAFYRTADGGVAPYYRLGTTLNNTTAATVTYADIIADASLISQQKLYSQPGVLGTSQDKRPPPGLASIVSYNGMLVGAAGSDVWFSGQDVSGEGTWFNPIFQVPVPGDGDITALWVMDGTLFVSKRRDIYAISGEAPSDNGAAGGLGQPRRLAVDVGCIEPRSPCVTALGTFFQSERGIEILTRSLAVEWIGEGVQATVASYPICTSITVDPSSSTVLVELAATAAYGRVTGNGRTAVYDLTIRAWVSTDRRKSSGGTADTPSQSACMVYTGSAWRYAWISAAGIVSHESAASYLDADGAIVVKRAISANIKMGGIQGHQHVNKALVFAKYHTAHDLNLSFAYDYSGTFKTARLYTAAELATLTTAIPNMQLEHGMHDDARCEAVRVQLQDVTPSSGTLGTGQGATWIALAFEVVPLTGAYGLPDVSR